VCGRWSLQILTACAIGAACVAGAGARVDAQAAVETYSAEATVKHPGGGEASAPVTIVIRSFATDADRDALLAAVKKGSGEARDLLAARPAAGSFEVGGKATPIKYAYARSVGSGRLITVVTAEPIHFVGGDLPDAKPKAGYDLGVALLQIDGATSTGEVAPAAQIGVDAQGAIVTKDYGAEVVRLTKITRK
jgi:hypothetical protein